MQIPYFRLFLLGVAVCASAGCDFPAKQQNVQKTNPRPLRLTYHVQDQEKVVDWLRSPDWQPRWQDSLVAQLERGAVRAYDRDNRPLPADSLPRARRLRGVVLFQGNDGHLRDGVLLHAGQDVRAYVPDASGPPALDLYFYDQAVSLELFYARVPMSVVEALTGRPLSLVQAN